MKTLTLLIAAILLTGCVTHAKYDATAVVPANTYTDVLVDMNVAFEIRCSYTAVSVIDTYGQIAMLSTFLTMDERVHLEQFLGDYAKEICET